MSNPSNSLQTTISQIVSGLGYDLVEIERSTGGLLRVTIDFPWQSGDVEKFVNVEDCEKVTRQLQFTLEVEGIDYARLEVSSPGIDRLLRHECDFDRFEGAVIDLTLKAAIGAAAQGQVNGNRKKFRGKLERVQSADGTASTWQIVWRDEPQSKPGQRVSKKKEAAPVQVLGFELNELKEARLAPIVDFKGRKTGIS